MCRTQVTDTRLFCFLVYLVLCFCAMLYVCIGFVINIVKPPPPQKKRLLMCSQTFRSFTDFRLIEVHQKCDFRSMETHTCVAGPRMFVIFVCNSAPLYHTLPSQFTKVIQALTCKVKPNIYSKFKYTGTQTNSLFN